MNDISKYLISEQSTLRDALLALNNLSDDVLTLFVIDEDYCLKGTLTDGDMRRGLIKGVELEERVDNIYNSNYRFVLDGNNNVAELKKYRMLGFSLLPCIDEHLKIVRLYNFKNKKTFLPIDAVLMAGGKGERLRPLTEKTPKPLLKVGLKPIIDYNVDSLIRYGVENIFVTVNYLKEQIEEHYSTLRGGIRVQCIREPEYLGTIGSVKFVENLSNDTVLVMNSDLFTNIDFEDFYLHYLESNADMSVAAVPYTYSIPYGILEMNEQCINGITEKPVYNYFANAGVYLVKRELFRLIPDGAFFNATDFMELLIKSNRKVTRYPLTGFWIDIGKHEDYKKVQELVKHMTF